MILSVKATIERYKKASADSSNSGSITEVSTQVNSSSSFLECEFFISNNEHYSILLGNHLLC